MDTKITKYINSIEIDTWPEIKENGLCEYRTRSVYCGDGHGDFEKRSYYTTIECLENYMLHCEDQKRQAFDDIIELNKRYKNEL
jgi:hypothetical protein